MESVGKEQNIILSSLSKNELEQLFFRINEMPLTFRRKLNIPSSISFGNEIEINGLSLDRAVLVIESFNDASSLYDNDRYVAHQEETADAEIVTPILTNEVWHWDTFKKMYRTLYETGATIGHNTSSHLHIGSHLINTPEKLSLFLKTLVVFEPIIFKFGYGYLDEPRSYLTSRLEHSIFSPMMTPRRVSTFTDELDHYNHKAQGIMKSRFLDFLAADLSFRPVFNFKDFDFSKLHHGIEIAQPSHHDHFEVRCFNGTLKPEIAQNNINLITSIVDAVIEGRIDREYIEKEYKSYKMKRYNFDTFCAILNDQDKVEQYNRLLGGFSKVKLEKALKLADMIFYTETDKYYFLKQYLKLFKADKEFVRALVK